MARVDIVIPLYNKAACVGRAIRSIRAQTVTDWRLIVVDDGSTDDGAEVVHGFDDRRIEMIRQENAGPGAARNAGIAKATAKYIAFLDADDEWYPWYLKNALQAIENKDVALVATMYCLWPGKQDMTGHWSRHKVRAGEYRLEGDEDPGWTDFLLNFPHVWNSVLYTETARKYDGFYDKDHCLLGEDTIFFLRICVNKSFAIIGQMGVCHHTEDSDLAQAATPPLAPFLVTPEVVLDYCPEEKRKLMSSVLDHMALRFARDRFRRGLKEEGIELLRRFPGARAFRWRYFRCRCAIPFSRWLPYWVRVKCLVGPPARAFIQSFARTLHLIPRLPQTNDTGGSGP